MAPEPKRGNGLGWLASGLALLCLLPKAFGQAGEMPLVVVSSTLFRPPTVQVQDKFYRDYLAGADEAIRLTYFDRWQFHEMQSTYHQPHSSDVHMDIATFTLSDVGPQEAQVRAEFARTAFRMRLDALFRKFLTTDKGRTIRQAQAVLNNLKAQSVRVSEAAEAAEIRLGYDVISDSSRLEWIKGSAGAGLYHGTFLRSLTGGAPLTQALGFNAWKNFNNGLPSASLGYVFGGKYLQGGLAKSLSPVVRTELLAVKPTENNGVPDSVLLRMTYTF